MQRVCDIAVATGLGGALIFAPLAFGAVHFRAYTTVQAVAIGIAIVWCIRTLMDSAKSKTFHADGMRPSPDGQHRTLDVSSFGSPHRPFRLTPFVCTGALLAAWLLFTIVPLPPAVLQALSPNTHALLVDTLPGWPLTAGYAAVDGGAKRGLFPATWRPLALSPFLAHAELLRILAYLIAFLIAAYYPWRNDRTVARRLVHVLLGVAVFEASYALIQESTGSPNIYWYRKAPSVWLPSGTYVNRNHFAGFLELVLPITGALALGSAAELLNSFRAVNGVRSRGQRRQMLGELLASRETFRLFLYSGAALWIFAALYRSLSRGGFLSPLAASCLLAPLLLGHGRSREGVKHRTASWLGPATVVLGAALFIATISLPELARRLSAAEVGKEAHGRGAVSRITLEMIADFPLAGIGLGSFELTFPAYRDFGGTRFTHVHNDYLELAVEAGLPSVVLAIVLLGAVYRRAARALRADATQPYILWGALVGATALLLHSFADFNMRIPANALAFAVVLGLTVRLSRPPRSAPPLRAVSALASAVSLAVLATIVAVGQRPARAEAAFRRLYPDTSLQNVLPDSGDPIPRGERIALLTEWGTTAARHPFMHYVTALELERDALRLLQAEQPATTVLRRASQHHARAARALPQWPGPHLQLGILGMAGVSEIRPAEAAAALRRARRRDPHHRGIAEALAKIESARKWLVDRD